MHLEDVWHYGSHTKKIMVWETEGEINMKQMLETVKKVCAFVTLEDKKAVFCNDEGVPTILVTVGGAAWANTRAAAMKSLPLSVCLRGVRLLLAWLAWKLLLLLLLFDLLRGLPVNHGNLLLVPCQGVGGQHCFATPTPLTALHGGLWHLHTGWKGGKRLYTHHTHNTSLVLPGIWHMAGYIQYLINMIANKHLLFLGKLRFP